MAHYSKHRKGQPKDESYTHCIAFMTSVCHTSQDAIIICDTNLHMKGVNKKAEAMFGYDECELTEQPLNQLIPGIEAVSDENTYLTLMTTGNQIQGRTFPIEVVLSAFEMDDEIHYMTIIRDMTAMQNGIDNDLSPRQRQVLKLVVQGYTSREIADQLTISIKTVETHRANIMNKLNVRNVSSLVRYAVEQEII
ncbi:MAG: LuxR C-terminal-related transcriptional regulator [Anaerolineae bacterium]